MRSSSVPPAQQATILAELANRCRRDGRRVPAVWEDGEVARVSSAHDEYIARAPERFRPILRELRGCVAAALPEADEVMGYGMLGFSIAGVTVVGYAAFSRQCGLYLPAEAITGQAESLTAAGLKRSKTGVTFTVARPIPDDLLDRLLRSARRHLGV